MDIYNSQPWLMHTFLPILHFTVIVLFMHVDVIMDMLGSPKLRQIITESYQTSNEPKLVKQAIRRARLVHSNRTGMHVVFSM